MGIYTVGRGLIFCPISPPRNCGAVAGRTLEDVLLHVVRLLGVSAMYLVVASWAWTKHCVSLIAALRHSFCLSWGRMGDRVGRKSRHGDSVWVRSSLSMALFRKKYLMFFQLADPPPQQYKYKFWGSQRELVGLLLVSGSAEGFRPRMPGVVVWLSALGWLPS